MIIDVLIYFISQYGIYILVLLLILKFFVLLWYKPSNIGYAFINIFSYYGDKIYYRVRDKDMLKFNIMKRYNNLLAIAIYPLMLMYILCIFIVKTLSHK